MCFQEERINVRVCSEQRILRIYSDERESKLVGMNNYVWSAEKRMIILRHFVAACSNVEDISGNDSDREI